MYQFTTKQTGPWSDYLTWHTTYAVTLDSADTIRITGGSSYLEEFKAGSGIEVHNGVGSLDTTVVASAVDGSDLTVQLTASPGFAPTFATSTQLPVGDGGINYDETVYVSHDVTLTGFETAVTNVNITGCTLSGNTCAVPATYVFMSTGTLSNVTTSAYIFPVVNGDSFTVSNVQGSFTIDFTSNGGQVTANCIIPQVLVSSSKEATVATTAIVSIAYATTGGTLIIDPQGYGVEVTSLDITGGTMFNLSNTYPVTIYGTAYTDSASSTLGNTGTIVIKDAITIAGTAQGTFEAYGNVSVATPLAEFKMRKNGTHLYTGSLTVTPQTPMSGASYRGT